MGEQSGSEAGASHRSQDDEEEDDNLSEDLEDDNEKDEGMFFNFYSREAIHSRSVTATRSARVARYLYL